MKAVDILRLMSFLFLDGEMREWREQWQIEREPVARRKECENMANADNHKQDSRDAGESIACCCLERGNGFVGAQFARSFGGDQWLKRLANPDDRWSEIGNR